MHPIQLQLSTILPQLTRNSANAEKKAGNGAGEPNIGQDIFSRLNELNAQSIQNRKSAAQARIAELKLRIENMMRFASIGKGNPHMVVQLAKELKSLVAQYGGTGGSMMAMPTASGTASSSESSNASEDAASAQAQADAAQVAAQASAQAATSEKGTTDAESTPNDKPDAPAHQFNIGQQGGDAGDKAFFAEVKKLSNMLKQMLAMENRKLKTEAEQHDFKVAKNSIREVEEAAVKAEANVAAEHAHAAQEGGAIYNASGEASVSSGASISIFA
ncbi:hypothetical protein HQ393_13300 [Chitinibacter bivalviorum]|uniref:Uncharacterized protein n=1 Tax=Chitinibacter bivalviorum TaxID=2739434 RepID=A0A7H9BKF2_9NEIS|nr:hypothetical protein [Chitinibacter bivalviorum]QLG89140.1 hypothetical protein HQ393_13300 [Chitinibacter bivalviorum]